MMKKKVMDKIVGGMYLSIGEQVMVLRKRKNLSQEQLAKKANIPLVSLAELEDDEYTNVTVKDIVSIGAVLDLSFVVSIAEDVQKLLGDEGNKDV
jgi:transcriptional regulator with XRE-family HTH domain